MKFGSRFSLVMLGLASWFTAPAAHSFTLNSSNNPNLKGWANGEITLTLNDSNCPAGIDVAAIVSEAAEIWNNVPTSAVKVRLGDDTTSTTWTSTPTVYCETNFQALLGADQNAVPGAAAVDGSTGQITRGILFLNASAGAGNIAHFDPTKLKIILAHEIGHIVGLGHSASSSALMFYDATARKEFRLSQDDMDGVTYLYPSDELKNGTLAGCGLIEKPTGPGDGDLLAALATLLIPLAFWMGLRKTEKPGFAT